MSSQARVHPTIQGILDAIDQAPGALQPPKTAAAPVNLPLEWTRQIQRLCATEPKSGYTDASQIGPLSGLEIAAVIAHDEYVLCDAVMGKSLVQSVTGTLSRSAYTTIEQAAFVGAALIGALTATCRTHLLSAVQAEIAKDDDARRADEADARAACEVSAAARSAWS